ncbi:MAG: hypothetical protein AAB583_03055 [Patescibacteria group bacterium]
MSKEIELAEWIGSKILDADKKINQKSAEDNANKLFKDLKGLGLEFTDLPESTIVNIPPISKFKEKADYSRLEVYTCQLTIPSPKIDISPSILKLISDSTEAVLVKSTYIVGVDMLLHDQPFQLFMHVQPEGVWPFSLNLTMPTMLRSNKELLFGSLPPDFTSVGFAYDLTHNPHYRDRLSSVVQKRVPAEIIDKDLLRKSSVRGEDTPEGVNTIIHLYLQDPSSQSFLECYETERFPQGSSTKNDTPEYVKGFIPEANWQDNENHNCLIPRKSDKTYPLFPSTRLDKISRFTMIVDYRGDSPKVMSNLLKDVPLSIDWTNQWYASTDDELSRRSGLNILYKPEWGENNTALMYDQISKERISPEQIHRSVVAMIALKKDIMQRLAA